MHKNIKFCFHTDALTNPQLIQAKNIIKSCDFLMITAGAGLGVDSGLPDFRGPTGF